VVKDKADKVELHRDWYPLSEVAEIAGLKVDDLIHLAMMMKLPIYIWADNWRPVEIFEVDNSDKFEINRLIRLASQPHGAANKEVNQTVIEIPISNDPRKSVFGNITKHERDGHFARLYTTQIAGFVRVARYCFGGYLFDPNTVQVFLDISALRLPEQLTNDGDELIVKIHKEILLQDALNEGKLVVMRGDLQRLISGDEYLPDDEKPDGGVSRKTLLKLVIGMAIGGYRYDPQAKRKDCMGAIEKRLDELDIPVRQDTIRKALEEASQCLPQKPQKS
jgi:hypothetical protein